MSQIIAPPTDVPRLSIVVPVYNEQENLAALHTAITTALAETNETYELIYVDDGSRDGGFGYLTQVAAGDQRVKLIRLRRNFGQTAAMAAGFDHAVGAVIVPLDADLQNDPRDIPRLLAKLDEGYDVVSGWRKDRQDTFVTRILPSLAANALISKITGVPLHDYGCTLKAYRADVLRNVRLYGEMHRFIPALAALEGGKVTEVPVSHHPRVAGKSKYGLSRTLKVFLDLLVVKFLGDYAKRPIHIFGLAGILLCLAGIASGAVTLYQKWEFGYYVHRNPLILLAIFLFLVGVQLFFMGLLAELMTRTYHESQGKHTYVVAQTVNLRRP